MKKPVFNSTGQSTDKSCPGQCLVCQDTYPIPLSPGDPPVCGGSYPRHTEPNGRTQWEAHVSCFIDALTSAELGSGFSLSKESLAVGRLKLNKKNPIGKTCRICKTAISGDSCDQRSVQGLHWSATVDPWYAHARCFIESIDSASLYLGVDRGRVIPVCSGENATWYAHVPETRPAVRHTPHLDSPPNLRGLVPDSRPVSPRSRPAPASPQSCPDPISGLVDSATIGAQLESNIESMKTVINGVVKVMKEQADHLIDLSDKLRELEMLVVEGHEIMRQGFEVQAVHVPKPGTLRTGEAKTWDE